MRFFSRKVDYEVTSCGNTVDTWIDRKYRKLSQIKKFQIN